ncbi:MAG: T9SS type A sorting domain-containing protein, partial [Bacteroidetes bacterium]|nr:T9SS type A sorting domain-containing protein [Bacteroidota bacterium]
MIEFTLTTEGRTKVQIMNLDGIKVMEKDLGFVDAGSPHQFEFSPPGDLSPGTYIYRIISGKEISTGKLIYMK